MKLYGEAFIRLLYPSFCGACSQLLEIEEKYLCSPCGSRLDQLTYTAEEALVDARFDSLDQAWTLYPYEPPVKDVLAGFKFSGKRWLVHTFKEAVSEFAATLASENVYDALLPIPIDAGRFFERGYNQSELIARMFAAASGIPVKNGLLRKKFRTPSQGSLSREEREINLYEAFSVPRNARLDGQSFLLIDDIFTTGSTGEEAARVLKQRGARRVELFALARTVLSAKSFLEPAAR